MRELELLQRSRKKLSQRLREQSDNLRQAIFEVYGI